MASDVSPYLKTSYGPALVTLKDFMAKTGRKGLSPEQLGRSIHKALTAARPKVRYTVVPNRLETFLMSRLPKRMVDRMFAKRLGLSTNRSQ